MSHKNIIFILKHQITPIKVFFICLPELVATRYPPQCVLGHCGGQPGRGWESDFGSEGKGRGEDEKEAAKVNNSKLLLSLCDNKSHTMTTISSQCVILTYWNAGILSNKLDLKFISPLLCGGREAKMFEETGTELPVCLHIAIVYSLCFSFCPVGRKCLKRLMRRGRG